MPTLPLTTPLRSTHVPAVAAPGSHPAQLGPDLGLLTQRAADRRRALRWLAVGGALPMGLLACGGGGGVAASSTGSSDSSSGSGSTSGSCSVIPEETAGPYPGDGSNTVNGQLANALALSGIVRSDITTSIAGASGVAEGVPLTLTLNLVNASASCTSLAGYAVYLWHCDQAGRYSMYSSGVTDENYLRGVQATDGNGQVSFTTIVPGCYDGRMPHMHFEIYPSLDSATSAAQKIKTSQLSFPLDMLNQAYASAGYETSVRNLASISFATDNVFSDGTSLQICSVTGSVAAGYAAELQVAISA